MAAGRGGEKKADRLIFLPLFHVCARCCATTRYVCGEGGRQAEEQGAEKHTQTRVKLPVGVVIEGGRGKREKSERRRRRR